MDIAADQNASVLMQAKEMVLKFISNSDEQDKYLAVARAEKRCPVIAEHLKNILWSDCNARPV